MRHARVLFARVGFMTFYGGPQQGDPRPVGGGMYTRKNIGHEAYNFRKSGRTLYGYFQPTMKRSDAGKKSVAKSTINLERILPGHQGDSVDNVLVLFVATRPKQRGQVLVGWYEDATVFRTYRTMPKATDRNRNLRSYYVKGEANKAVLLPTWRRPQLFDVTASKKGKPGQANAYYLYDHAGPRDVQSKNFRWIAKALEFVESYEGENLLTDPSAEAALSNEENLERASSEAVGQGFNLSPYARVAIEKHAMRRAARYFARAFNFDVDDTVHETKPFDILCTDRATGSLLHVEVKGTQTRGVSVFLTRNEVESANRRKSALYLLHSIKVTGKGGHVKASGGKAVILNPWILDPKRLTAVNYSYSVTAKGLA